MAHSKNILIYRSTNHGYKPRRLVPLTGAYRDRHERGAGCGGRGSVGRVDGSQGGFVSDQSAQDERR
jgi:hypothetical protein